LRREGICGKGAIVIRFFASVVIGLIAGAMGGLVGVGGGVFMVPLMSELLKVRQHEAHGTSLVAIVFTGTTGAIAYGLQKSVDIVAAILLAATAVLTARWGAKFTAVLPEWKLKRSFGAFLIFSRVFDGHQTLPSRFSHWRSPLGQSDFTLGHRGFHGFSLGHDGSRRWSHHVARDGAFVGIEPAHCTGNFPFGHGPDRNCGGLDSLEIGAHRLGHRSGIDCWCAYRNILRCKTCHSLPENQLRFVFVAFVVAMSLHYLTSKPPKKNSPKI